MKTARPGGSTAAGSGTASGPERGHLLVGLMVLVAVLLILLTATGQTWTFLVRRDNEAELIFRGEQYAKAIDFYKKETGQYPLDLKALMQRGPHRHRYIRRLWSDPLAKDGKWGRLYMSPTGKGFINPYATRRDQQQFIAGSFGDQGPGGGAGKSSFGGKEDEKAGYSEPLPANFDRESGDIVGLPIVGVVHKKKESGLKIYMNQANLNDWAFTLLAEGQDLKLGGAVLPPKGTPRNFGIGDTSTPIFLNPADKPGMPKRGSAWQQDPIKANLDKEREEDRKREREQQEQADDQDQDNPDGENPPPDTPHDPNAPRDPNAPHDPNAPQDPNAPRDPNGTGV